MKKIIPAAIFVLMTTLSSCGQNTQGHQNNVHSKAKTAADPTLRSQLDSIYDDDQKYRHQMDEIEKKHGWESKEMTALWTIINKQDSANLIKVTTIINKYGWPGKDMVGEKGNSALFLVIQHADPATQQKYLPIMRKAVKKGNASGANLALLEDRVALGTGKKQIYGSQIGRDPISQNYYVRPLDDPESVDKRRMEAGLLPMAQYVSQWQIKWDAKQYKTDLRIKEQRENPKGLKKFYDEFNVEGSFILFDQKNDRYTYYNQAQTYTSFTPASTFKICNSLIALETGIVENERVTFKWDGRKRQISAWNGNTDMKNAFKNSTVWYYQELARRIGEKRMKNWLDKVRYGNADIGGGIDGFWLWGGLRITPRQQIDFLRLLQMNKLPFSQRSMDIVKHIMIAKDSEGYVVRSKTGSGKQDNLYIGWYVGYITTEDNVYYFSNCIQTSQKKPEFEKARLDITYNILNELKLPFKQN